MTQPAQTLCARIAYFVLRLELAAVPANVQRLARLHIADALGVGLASSSLAAFGGLARRLRRSAPLAQRIAWSPHDESRFPAQFDAALSVTLKDGRVLHHAIDDVFGSATRQGSEDYVRAKFVGNASRALDAQRVDDSWQAVPQGGSLAGLQLPLCG
jgi:hypothetical protein